MKKQSPTPLLLLNETEWKGWLKGKDSSLIAWAKQQHFNAKAGEFCIFPAIGRSSSFVIAGISSTPTIWSIAALPEKLPPATYELDTSLDTEIQQSLYLGWLLGSHRFTRYKQRPSSPLAQLIPPPHIDLTNTELLAESICMARDLITTPANDLGPEELAIACKQVAKHYKAEYSEIVGEKLLTQNYPAIYEVGKASSRVPRLIDIRWGNRKHPKVTLVGKGVCFDSGGLDIKPSSGMKLMKKDMGGAACVLALAKLIMGSQLPVRLRVLIPAVENSIAGNAYRPSDVIRTRKGLSVEVGNTDAEGRLILCDALFEADEESPELLLDFATLTGAARTALGTDIPALFSTSDTLANQLTRHAHHENDPLWRLPLWEGYRDMLNSQVADINSAPDGPYAGAITAALYLKEFVTKTSHWAHIDMMAWNLSKRPGRPVGGEAMAVRAVYAYISERFPVSGKKS